MDIKKLILGILTSFLILISCFSNLSASAEITAEQEVLNYFLSSTAYNTVQGLPYTPSYFMNFQGWTNAKVPYNNFVGNSAEFNNRIYITDISDTKICLRIYAYDYITSVGSSTFKANSYAKCELTLTLSSNSVSCASSTGTSGSWAYFASGSTTEYISISYQGSSVVYDEDSDVLYSDCSLDEEKKSPGILQGLKNLLTGKFSLVDVLFDTDVSLVDNLNLLGNSFNGWLSDLIDVNIDTSSDEYNQLLLDLENNTQNSAYINNVSQDTLNQIRNTYQNLKNTFDNSVSVYSDDDNNYKYTTNNNSTYTNTNGDTVTNFNDYMTDNSTEDNSSTVNNYFNTYILDSTDTGDNSNTGTGTGDSGGCNCNNSANANATIGDIIINNNIPSGSGSGTGSEDVDIDISSFEKMINQCKNYWLMVTNLINMLPAEISLSFASLITVVVICRILGR